jgi:GDPmannose 4,6-dehydratase
MRKALICGISGQDGAYLAEFLLSKGYEVFGGSRDATTNNFGNLKRLNIFNQVQLVSINLTDFRSTLQTINKIRPDEIYNLSGQSSVGLSFEQPIETFESICIGTLNILEAIRFCDTSIKFYNAGSSECFGNSPNEMCDENTLFKPKSPYGIAKASAHWQVVNYREAYNLFTVNGILFNHESPLRPDRFVTQKVIKSVTEIAAGKLKKLEVGNIDIVRDWGWAPDYVQAMWAMLQQEIPDDFVISTGKGHSLKEFIAMAFNCVNLEMEDYLNINQSLFRPTDLLCVIGNPQKARKILGWSSNHELEWIVNEMFSNKINF